MRDAVETNDPWRGDGLNFSAFGATFTNLIKSIDDSKVISIEAGFGQGKTFFRCAWAEHLRASGELVIEIDAQQSDHSGDPIITFMSALLSAKPADKKPLSATIKQKSLKLAGVAGKAMMRAVLKNGAEEILDSMSAWAQDHTPGNPALDKAIEEVEAGLSKAASQLIATHLAAEKARLVEFPAQIDALRDALTEGGQSTRIIILIDELDRCHPEYAIALLESMKLVFGRKGFIFCMMVNPHYLESIAKHRFGTRDFDELYLEKFVDLRLALKPSAPTQGLATKELIRQIHVEIPFGVGECFSVEAAAALAELIVQKSNISFRQIKRVVERIDLVARCYRGTPIDLPFLVYLAFSEVARTQEGKQLKFADSLPRAKLTPEKAKSLLLERESLNSIAGSRSENKAFYECENFVRETCSDLIGLDVSRYKLPPSPNGGSYYDWYKVLGGLGPTYWPTHRDMLDCILEITA